MEARTAKSKGNRDRAFRTGGSLPALRRTGEKVFKQVIGLRNAGGRRPDSEEHRAMAPVGSVTQPKRMESLMTLKTGMPVATSFGAIMALLTMPAVAQVTDDGDLTASDLGVDTELQAEAGATEAETEGDAAMTAESEYSDEKLNAFVAAALGVRDVRDDYARQIAEVTDEAAAEALVAEAQAEMVAAIENAEDITLEEYSAIGNAAQTDPELAERLTALFEAEVGEMDGEDEDQS